MAVISSDKNGRGVTVTDEGRELMSIREAAKTLGVHPSTLRNWDRAGRLKAVRVGSRRDRRFKKSEVLAEAEAQGPGDPVVARALRESARAVDQHSLTDAPLAEAAKALGTTPGRLRAMVSSQVSIRDAWLAEVAKTLGTTPAGLKEMVASYEAAMDAFNPMRAFASLWEDSLGYPLKQLTLDITRMFETVPRFHQLVDPILWEQKSLAERLRESISSIFEAEPFSSGVYARLAATRAELSSMEAIATLAGSFEPGGIVGATSLVWDQIGANIGAYQDLTRAVLWDLDAVAAAGDKRLPFAELKLAGGLLQSATSLVADLPTQAGQTPAATVKKPNLFRCFHNDARQVRAPEQLSDGQLEAQLRATASFRAGNAGHAVVEALDQVNRALLLRGQDPIFQPSVETGAIAARLCLSCAGDEAELGEVCDGLYKFVFEASDEGRRLRPLAEPREYEAVEHIVILRNDYRHDLAQGTSPRSSRRRLGKVGEVLQHLAGNRLPSSPADWQRVFLALMGEVRGLLRGVAARLEDRQ